MFFPFTARQLPASTLFPYTTLFRSALRRTRAGAGGRDARLARGDRGDEGERGDGGKEEAERARERVAREDRKSTRLNSSHGYSSYAVFCLKKKNSNRETRLGPPKPI